MAGCPVILLNLTPVGLALSQEGNILGEGDGNEILEGVSANAADSNS